MVIILEMLRQLFKTVSDDQFAFVEGKSTTEAIL